MATKLLCPREGCRNELKAGKCDTCGSAIQLIEKSMPGRTPEQLAEMLHVRLWAYKDLNTKELVLPGRGICRALRVSPEDVKPSDLTTIVRILRSKGELVMADDIARLLAIFWDQEGMLPGVHTVSSRPWLFEQDGQLVWPFGNPESTQAPIYNGLYYTGPALCPVDNGVFEEFLASVRCVNDESRDVLRGWMMGTLLAQLHDPGAAPMLLLCAQKNGMGKTATAETIGALLGGSATVVWSQSISQEELFRQAMDSSVQALIVDNIAPDHGSEVFTSNKLAALITQRELTVKRMYTSTGIVRANNRIAILGTANVPVLASELLSRMVICEIGRTITKEEAARWSAGWIARRNELLANMLWLAVNRWSPRRPACTKPCRFSDWQAAVARALDKEPTLVPRSDVIGYPLDMALTELFLTVEGESLALEEVVRQLSTAQMAMCRHVRRHMRVDVPTIVSELKMYPSQYVIVDGEVKHA